MGSEPEPRATRPDPDEPAGPERRASLDEPLPDSPDAAGAADVAGEHQPSATDPPNARPDDDLPDERWDDPTGA